MRAHFLGFLFLCTCFAEGHKPAVPSCSLNADFPVCTQNNLLDKKTCAELIAAAERNNGYDVGFDSLDGKPAVQIDIMEGREIQHPDLYAIIEPHMDKLGDFIGQHFDVEFVYWIFLRRYSASGNFDRKGVRIHSDSSGATIVVPLTEDFQGGAYQILNKNIQSDEEAEAADESMRYRPVLKTGSALIHDGVIRHGVEPVTQGTRYSLIIFFSVGRVTATFTNDLPYPINVFWVHRNDRGETEKINIFDEGAMSAGEQRLQMTSPSAWFEAQDNGGTVVAEWEIHYAPYEQRLLASQSNRGENPGYNADWAAQHPRQLLSQQQEASDETGLPPTALEKTEL